MVFSGAEIRAHIFRETRGEHVSMALCRPKLLSCQPYPPRLAGRTFGHTGIILLNKRLIYKVLFVGRLEPKTDQRNPVFLRIILPHLDGSQATLGDEAFGPHAHLLGAQSKFFGSREGEGYHKRPPRCPDGGAPGPAASRMTPTSVTMLIVPSILAECFTE
jgi:hypothetical protein